MIVVQLMEGLGNQMFQYAYGLYLSEKYKCPLYLSKSLYQNGRSGRNYALDIFNLDDRSLDFSLVKKDDIQNKEVYFLREKEFHFNKAALNPINNGEDVEKVILITHGCWQSSKYFSSVSDILKGHFQFKNKLINKCAVLKQQLLTTNSIMIHIRRGDYLNQLPKHGVVSIDYIQKAIKYLSKRFDDMALFVFSDDIEWCRENIQGYKNIVFVDESYYDNNFQYCFQLMTSCKHFIIANSTFSWWAAWLASNEDKIIIAPKKWFSDISINSKDIIPSNWIKF